MSQMTSLVMSSNTQTEGTSGKRVKLFMDRENQSHERINCYDVDRDRSLDGRIVLPLFLTNIRRYPRISKDNNSRVIVIVF